MPPEVPAKKGPRRAPEVSDQHATVRARYAEDFPQQGRRLQRMVQDRIANYDFKAAISKR
jgi:hypothetical protein